MNEGPRILVYSIDGMNRAGKGTQLELAKKYLNDERKIPTVILRGYGRRIGIEDDIYENVEDKVGFWKQFKMATILNTSKVYNVNVCHRGGDKLEEEFLCYKRQFLEKLKSSKSNLGVILLDRSWIMRFDVEKQRKRNCSVKKIYKESIIKPDYQIIIDVTQEELLRRLKEDKTEKREFRLKMIKENYPDFVKTISMVQKFLKDKLSIVDGNRKIEVIHKDIKKIIDDEINPFLWVHDK